MLMAATQALMINSIVPFFKFCIFTLQTYVVGTVIMTVNKLIRI